LVSKKHTNPVSFIELDAAVCPAALSGEGHDHVSDDIAYAVSRVQPSLKASKECESQVQAGW
jgi:hypothetical protein